jgi:MSHA biogenesis protein MshP
MSRTRAGQSGFAAIAAIVLLTVLAGLGAFMVSFSNVQQLNTARDMQSTRAYWAARTGIDWALSALTIDNTACPTPPSPFTVDTGNPFTLTIVCSAQTYQEGDSVVTIYLLESRASTGTVGSIAYVERSLAASYEVPQ